MQNGSWVSLLLRDLVVLNSQVIDNNYSHKVIKYLDTASVTNNFFDKPQTIMLNQAPSRAKRLVRQNDTIISTVRPIQKHFGYINDPPDNLIVSTGFVVVRPVNIDGKFLYYLLTQELITEFLNQIAETTTTAYPSFQPDILNDLEVMIPENLHEQRAIADVLSALDDKIDLNRRINATLEQLAWALYNHMFIDNPEREGWEEKDIQDITHVVKGVSYSSSELVEESDSALVTLKSIERGGGYKQEGLKPFLGKYKPGQEVFPGEVVVAHTDLTHAADVIGHSARVEPSNKYSHLIASLDLSIVRPKDELISNEFIFGLLSFGDFSEFAYGYTNGTTVLHLSNKALQEFRFSCPPSSRILEYTQMSRLIYQLMDNNNLENRTLAELRDTLLPKLMSGQVRVSPSVIASAQGHEAIPYDTVRNNP